MKITINTSDASFDPAATCTEKQLAASLAAYGREIEDALASAFPGAAIFHEIGDFTYGHSIEGLDGDDYTAAMDEVQRIIEGIYETGNFWS
jgi:hypothetical protein